VVKPLRDDYFGFLAYVDALAAQRLTESLDAAFADLAFHVTVGTTQTAEAFSRTYEHPSGWSLSCAGATGDLDTRPGWAGWRAWGLHHITYEQVRSLPNDVLVDAIGEACVRTASVLGRSYDSSGSSAIEVEELIGQVNILDWLQYFGPEASVRIGAGRIRTAGFFAIKALPNGGHLARTRDTYLDEWPFAERRPVVDRLGITPRKLLLKVAANEWGEMRWC
jgi:hypothetical protein